MESREVREGAKEIQPTLRSLRPLRATPTAREFRWTAHASKHNVGVVKRAGLQIVPSVIAERLRVRGRTGAEIATIILGVVMVAVGACCVVSPHEMAIFHPAGEGSPSFLEWVTQDRARAYGVLGMLAGCGLMWFATQPARGVKGRAIERFVWQLPQALTRRFGIKNHFTIEEVTRTAREAGYNMAFIAYAHALFCTRESFDEYYEPLHVACSYDGLRATVSKRYFGGARDFDAGALIRMAKEPYLEENSFHQGVAG